VHIRSKNSEVASGDGAGGTETSAGGTTGGSNPDKVNTPPTPKTTVRPNNTTIASATNTGKRPEIKNQGPKITQSPQTTQAEKTVAQPDEQTGQSGDDALKQEFLEAIRGWQTLKKTAVRNCDTTILSKVLSGKALDKQTLAIGWLVKKKDYYELIPKGVTVDRYEEVPGTPKRYAVYAQVKELSRLMDQTTNKMLSERDDAYKVKYTIEKTGDHWSIYDSDVIKSTATTPTGGDQSKATNKPKH